jgi:hypothetical protein
MADGKLDIFDFMEKAKRSSRLTSEFKSFKDGDPKKLKKWFVQEGFEGISLTQCKKLIHYQKFVPPQIRRLIDEKGTY